MQNKIQNVFEIHKTPPSVTMRFCILPETEELFNDISALITSNGIDTRQIVALERENLNLNNNRIRTLIDKAIISSKNLICIYAPPSPPASKWFDAIVALRYENETETRVKAFFLKHFRDNIAGEQKFIDPLECLEALALEEKSTKPAFDIDDFFSKPIGNEATPKETNSTILF